LWVKVERDGGQAHDVGVERRGATVERDYFYFLITSEVHDLIELVMVRVHRVSDWIFYISFVFIIFTSIYLWLASHRLGRLQRNH
jgi:hypothetical protein